MKEDLYLGYQQIRNIRESIDSRIQNNDIKDYLELVIKNNFLESQNVQLLLNLQLQARTIIDFKSMITKQQKIIEDYDIAGSITDKNLELFLDDANDQDGDDDGDDDNQDQPTLPDLNDGPQSYAQNDNGQIDLSNKAAGVRQSVAS